MTTYANYIEQYIACLEAELELSVRMKPDRRRLVEKQVKRGKSFLKSKTGKRPPSILLCPPNPKYLNTDLNFKFLLGMLADLNDEYAINQFLLFFHLYFKRAMNDILANMTRNKELENIQSDAARDYIRNKYDSYCIITAGTLPQELQDKMIQVVLSYRYVTLENMLMENTWLPDDEVQQGYSQFFSEFFIFILAINKYIADLGREPSGPSADNGAPLVKSYGLHFFSVEKVNKRLVQNQDAISSVSNFIQAEIVSERQNEPPLSVRPS